jgi:non-ribosomal peptide synthetase component F
MVNHLAPIRTSPTVPGLRRVELPYRSGTTPFDLTFTLIEGERRTLQVEYDRELFSPVAARRTADRTIALARAMAAHPQTPLGRLPWMGDGERAWLERVWTGPERVGLPGTLHDLVAQAARRTPNALAVRDGERTVTFGELVARADRVARSLRVRGARPGTRVLVALERSLDGVVALLAVFQPGAAAMMAPPSMGAQRLSLMLADGTPVLAVVADGVGPRPVGLSAFTLAELEVEDGPAISAGAGPGRSVLRILHVRLDGSSERGPDPPRRAS